MGVSKRPAPATAAEGQRLPGHARRLRRAGRGGRGRRPPGTGLMAGCPELPGAFSGEDMRYTYSNGDKVSTTSVRSSPAPSPPRPRSSLHCAGSPRMPSLPTSPRLTAVPWTPLSSSSNMSPNNPGAANPREPVLDSRGFAFSIPSVPSLYIGFRF